MTNKKILTLISLLLLFSFLMVGCKLFPPPNHEPVITTLELPAATVGTAYTATVVATDADGDALTFSLVSGPTDMIISEAGDISGWTPITDEIGDVTVKVAVTDGITDSVSAPFTITVSEAGPVLLTSIIVLPETMDFSSATGSKTITSVTAHYSDGSEDEIDLDDEDIAYESSDNDVAEVSDVGKVTVKGFGETTITVSYTEVDKSKTVISRTEKDTIAVKVIGKVHNTDADLYYSTIKAAIDDARTGETIEVAAGTYPQLTDTLEIDVEGLTLKSTDGYDDTTITSTTADPCIQISAPDVTVEGFGVKVGQKYWNAISIGAPNFGVNVSSAIVTDNKIYNGAIFCGAGGDKSEITDNIFVVGDIGINLNGNPGSLDDVIIKGNNGNIALLNHATVESFYDNIQITYNTISGCGRGMLVAGTVTDLTITNNDITYNENVGIDIGEGSHACTWGTGNVINYNNIADNGLGIQVAVGTITAAVLTVDVTNNWWGDKTGPSGLATVFDAVHPTITLTDGGDGDEIVDNAGTEKINFYPFSKVEN